MRRWQVWLFRWGLPLTITVCWALLASLGLRAWVLLGHWPRETLDDPRDLGFGWHYEVTGRALWLGTMLTIWGGLSALGILAWNGRKAWREVAPTIVVAVVSAWLFRATPLVSWYMD